jgi:hypothetical protein
MYFSPRSASDALQASPHQARRQIRVEIADRRHQVFCPNGLTDSYAPVRELSIGLEADSSRGTCSESQATHITKGDWARVRRN